ncbi:transposable element Tcb1 transposase [Trichonephila clavipes]|nr:transposable element Tcb1 transposase [Trichonephila clavipes]
MKVNSAFTGSDGHQKVWRKANAALEPKNMRVTVKHGGDSIMVWGCMAATGVANVVIIDEIMNQYSYLNILKNILIQSASKLGLYGSFTFQKNNDPKHTARVVREWLLYNVRKQVKTHRSHLILIPLNTCGIISIDKLESKKSKLRMIFKKALLEEWLKIPSSVTQNLVKSVPSRLRAVIKAKGYPTNY